LRTTGGDRKEKGQHDESRLRKGGSLGYEKKKKRNPTHRDDGKRAIVRIPEHQANEGALLLAQKGSLKKQKRGRNSEHPVSFISRPCWVGEV